MFAKILLSSIALATSVLAQSTAIVVVEASQGGAGNNLSNTTITVPLNKIYTNAALSEVSTLYLTGASGVPVSSIVCTPYIAANGTGSGGNPFTSSTPSLLSTNTVQVGSLVCRSSGVSNSTISGTGISGSYATTTGSASKATSTFLTTMTGPNGQSEQSTITSVFTPTATNNSSSVATTGSGSAGSSTTSASASLSSGNAANGLRMPSEQLFGGLALAGLGVAFAL